MSQHERSDRILLPVTEARCEPSEPCLMRGRCARYGAVILRGAPLGDYSVEESGGTALCRGYADAAQFRRPRVAL